MDAPLAGRKMHYWVKPFGKQSAGIDVYERIASHDIAEKDQEQGVAEAKRLLYVSLTRARDLLILPFAATAKQRPWLDCLEAEWLTETDGQLVLPNSGEVACAHKTLVATQELTVSEGEKDFFAFPGQKVHQEKPAAFVSPSSLLSREAAVGQVYVVSPRISFRGKPEMDLLGNAVHSILASDCIGSAERKEMASRTLESWGVSSALVGEEILHTSESLRHFLQKNFTVKALCPEWPVQMVLENGQLLSGWIDLAVDTETGWLIIDHKSFPAGSDMLEKKALEYSGQLHAYQQALVAATGKRVEKTMIFFPISGRLVEVVLGG